MKQTFPELTSSPVTCNSWVCTNKTGNITRETYNRETAFKAFEAGWTVKTAHQHLINFNKTLKD